MTFVIADTDRNLNRVQMFFHRRAFGVYNFFRSLKRAYRIFLILTRGEYNHSGWDGKHDYVEYHYKGFNWRIPLTGIEECIPTQR